MARPRFKAIMAVGIVPAAAKTGTVVHLPKPDGGLREITLFEEISKALDGLIVARIEKMRMQHPEGHVLSSMNIAYESGRDAAISIDADEAVWKDAEWSEKPLADLTFDYWSWFPRIQPLVTDASLMAKGFPPELGEWFAEVDAGQQVRFRTPWGVSPGIPRRIGYGQGLASAAWRSKLPQDPLLRVLEQHGAKYEFAPRLRAGEPVTLTGKAYSDDARTWAPGWEGLETNCKLISFAAPRLGIGLKPNKIFARGNAAAGDPPPAGLWVESWDEAAG